MPRFLTGARVAFAVALALLNAFCFVRCLVQSCDSGAMTCHSHGPAKAHACPPQHDFKAAPASVSSAIPVVTALNLTEAKVQPAAPWRADTSGIWSPPPAFPEAPRLLRI